MKTYVITNLKGGVGKTTTAANLGYSMAVLGGKRILLVDADPQSNLTPFFTKNHGDSGRTIREVFKHPARIKHIIVKSKYENIDIIKGSVRLKEADAANEYALSEALNHVKDEYDICIIDTRPAIEQITRSALHTGDVFLTPVLLDKFCRDNLLLLEDELQSIEYEKETQWKIFANKVENKRSQRNTYADMVGKHDWQFCETCVSKGAVVENALELYKPVIRHRSRSVVAQDYMDLAGELLGIEISEVMGV